MTEDLLLKYIKGTDSDEETEQVVHWLNENETNRQGYEALSKVYYISLFNVPDEQEKTIFKKRENSSLRKISFELLKIAAIFLIVWGLNIFIHQDTDTDLSENYLTVYAPAGQRSELVLPDSTKVWLNAKTKISYPPKFGKKTREVWIEGEAYFEVKRDIHTPFIVKTEEVSVKVLGTDFNIISYPNTHSTDVALLNGKVEFIINKQNKTYEMKPNERVKLSDGQLHKLSSQEDDYFKWREGLLCFNNESVESIFKKMELYFNITIIVKKPELLKHRYSGKFRIDDGVEQMLKILQLENSFHYKKDNNLNVITII